jgi:hypothetical protein
MTADAKTRARVATMGQALQLAGIVAAVVLAFLVNLLAARHFTRWDWTRDKRWSLSPATLETLHDLEQPVDIWAIAGAGDPVERGLRELLASYRAASSRVDVHWIDPDRDVAQLIALESRFGLGASKTENGRVATDAVVIVASGDKHWFLTRPDLFQVEDDDVHAKPREERALTQAVRSVLGGTRAKLCFTVGHGELSLDPGRDEREGLGALRSLLEKNNYDLASVDLSGPGAHEPFAGCTVAVIAGASAPFAPIEADRLRAWLLQGGSLLAAVGPLDPVDTRMPSAGLDEVLAPFGVALDDDLVHDVDPAASVPDTHGEGFIVSARPHPVTVTLVAGGADAHPPRVAAFFTRSMRHMTSPGAAAAADLLVTSDGAYAKTDIAGAATWTDAPPRATSDPGGPFVIAMASERPRVSTSAPRGPRAVVLGSRYFFAEDNWRQPRPVHGAAFLVDSALSWLAARPEIVDVPDRPEVAAGVRISEGSLAEVERYVLVYMPLAALLMGASVWLWRRSSENKPYERETSKEPPA